MSATLTDIKGWIKKAQDDECEFLIIGYDTYDHGNFPCYCDSEKQACETLERLRKTGNVVDEIYDFSISMDIQLKERRAFHYPKSYKQKGVL